MYEYEAVVERVVDGDTVDLIIDLGMHVHIKERCRLYGINAPERYTETGRAATEFLRAQIEGKPLKVRTRKDKQGKYGRYLVTIYLGTWGTNINELMVLEGHAVEYMK